MKRKKLITISLFSFLCLLACAFASISYGAKSLNILTVIQSLFGNGSYDFSGSVVQARIGRTVFGILAGAALSISGALMQAVTRNPISDPSILGVNTGASLFVVCGISFLHISTGNQYILLAFSGAAITAILVYGLAFIGYGGATPMKLALAGAAASTALQSLVNTVMLPNTQVMDQFRFWQTGSISGATWEDIRIILPWLMAGFILSFALASSLNTLALGDETAAGLGLRVNLIRGLAALAGVLLCAATTALAGPIGFIGLMVPHFMRLIFGPDMHKVLPFSAIGGSCILLLADVAGRLLGKPGELESGIITAIAGAPVFILIIRKAKVYSL
ncbi:iron ABC transporter permease [Clostridium boliviensis]|uniref:Iron ABC transporter permease n=1 Tax=Clostridium boliviensis TaxID=318465 RepID=A0ABU4GGI6_9CLOT|nr:iron ABC transporter permease [Clostridium boliviensis]MDW2796065.1 iron ABC transporter permease [Clostridium boliviensis]